jgi:spore coat polysaccharide biosynthesis predicted glycosyltransferase SpsG
MTQSMPLRRILFVCRGSTRDGLGHIMRSRSVAKEMSRLAAVKMLVIGESYVDALLRGRGLNYEVASDESQFAPAVRTFKPDVIVFDTLTASAATIRLAKSQAMVVSLSPVFDQLREMDLVFHRTKYHGSDWKYDLNTGPELRCSLDYAVVRDNCIKISHDEFSENLGQDRLAIAVSMGGADAGNKTLKMLRALTVVQKPLLIWTLLGEGYAHSYEALVECVRQSTQHEIILAKTSDSMWRVLKTCCLAVLAGGTITYEAAYAGLPSINLFENDKHVFLVNELVDQGVCVSAGHPMEDAVDVAAANISLLESDRPRILEMHELSKGLIDGRAGRRISEEILDSYWVRYFDLKNTQELEASRKNGKTLGCKEIAEF